MTTLTSITTAAVLPLSIISAPLEANDSRWQDWIDQRIARGSDRTIAIMQFADGEATCFFRGALGEDRDRRPDRRTRFEIGSISKVFTNLLLGELAATGRVGFDTTIGEVLGPGFAPTNPAVANITLQSLATHTSGLPRLPANFEPLDPLDPYRGYDAGQLLEAVAQLAPVSLSAATTPTPTLAPGCWDSSSADAMVPGITRR